MAAFWTMALCASVSQAFGFSSTSWTASHFAAGAEWRAPTSSVQDAPDFHALASASSRRPVLMPPRDALGAAMSKPKAGGISLLGVDSGQGLLRKRTAFQPSAEFQSTGGQEQGSDLPWGIGSPRDDDPRVHIYSGMPTFDSPKYLEYSLEAGNNIQSFSSAQQDVKLITQVLENVTNGFYLDAHGGDGETDSNTLLLEITGWRGLVLEPDVYKYSSLWSKIRKAWLFLGALSPHGNATKVGFDRDGLIDELSGFQIHAYPLTTFMEQLGGRKTVDFWNLHNGGYEAEVLNETLFHSGKTIEFGVILVRFDGRRSGRGWQPWVQHRSKDATEELIFEIMHNASFSYIGGLDAYWINYVEPRYHYKDHVWVNRAYFDRRGLPVPSVVKAAPPPKPEYPRPAHIRRPGLPHLDPWNGLDTWDQGYSHDEEVDKIMAYIKKAKRDAAFGENPAKAAYVSHPTRLAGATVPWGIPR